MSPDPVSISAEKPTRVLFVSAEASGDYHAADVVRALKKRDQDLEVDALGGTALEQAGARLVAHVRSLSVMGFSEVLRALPRILKVRARIKEAIIKNHYACAVLIDGPDFNFGLFKALKKASVPIVYYIPPKLWASRARRLKKLRKYADVICAIFPFEEEWYAQRQCETVYVGHPVAEQIERYLGSQNKGEQTTPKETVALLPGSRSHEIHRLLPYYVSLVKKLQKEKQNVDFVLPKAPTVDEKLLAPLKELGVEVMTEGTLKALANARAAVVASGTATLETALMQVPQVVIYRVGWLTSLLFHLLVRLKFVSPVNIILDKPAVPELLQSQLTHDALYNEVYGLLEEGDKRHHQLADCKNLKTMLRGEGASEVVARIVREQLP